MLTASMLYQVCRSVNPRSTPLRAYVDAFTSEEGRRELAAWGIDTKARLAAFMANVCHETGGLTVIRENMNYRPGRIRAVWSKSRARKVLRAVAGLRYGTQAWRVGIGRGAYGDRLGNEDDGTNDDDGYNYRGGGPLQSTGKDNYRYLERKLGLPFVANPELIEVPEHWVKIAALTWCDHPSAGDLNPFADHGNFKGCCRGINCGSPYRNITPVGWSDRQTWFVAWKRALADGEVIRVSASVGVTYRVGMPYSKIVEGAQARLNELGYADKRLAKDGLYGPRVRSAVQDFETENGLEVTGTLSPDTLELLMSPYAKPWPKPAEAFEGVSGLKKSDDPEIKAAHNDKIAATALAAGGAVKAAKDAGLFESTEKLSKDAGIMQTAFQSLLSVANFCVENMLPLLLIFVGLLLWLRYGRTIRRRVESWSRPTGE